MMFSLAYAAAPDSSNSNFLIVLLGAAVFAIAATLAAIPNRIASNRDHRFREAIVGFTLLWAIVASASAIYYTMEQFNWSKEHTLRIESGYYDPREKDEAPALPWPLWAGLAITYGGLIVWSNVPGKMQNEEK